MEDFRSVMAELREEGGSAICDMRHCNSQYHNACGEVEVQWGGKCKVQNTIREI